LQKDKRTQKPKIWIYKDKATGSSKGECTITYDDAHTATSAIEWFDGKEFNGSIVKVQLAQRTGGASWQKGPGMDRGGPRKFGSGGGDRGGKNRKELNLNFEKFIIFYIIKIH
jgi:RNA-binding protein FUS